jgi:hypothetical protein
LELERDNVLLALEKIQLIPVERKDFDIARELRGDRRQIFTELPVSSHAS